MLRKLAIIGVVLYAVVFNQWVLGLPQNPTNHPTDATATSYDTKFDNIDIDEILHQERLLKNYVKCLENKGPCTPDAKMLKETLPDAIATNCAKCSTKQKYGSDRVTHFLIDNRPEDWERLEKIYDPQGTYKRAYMADKTNNNNNNNTKQESSTISV